MIILKVTENHGFILSLEDIFFKNPQEEGAGRMGLELQTSIVKENVRLDFRLKIDEARTYRFEEMKYNNLREIFLFVFPLLVPLFQFLDLLH